MTTEPIAITNELLDRFPQFAGVSEIDFSDIRTALAGESEHERAEAARVLHDLEADGRLVRLMALTDQLGALLTSILPGAQAAAALWSQIRAEIEQASDGQGDAVWSEVHERYVDVVAEQALAVASMIANEDVR